MASWNVKLQGQYWIICSILFLGFSTNTQAAGLRYFDPGTGEMAATEPAVPLMPETVVEGTPLDPFDDESKEILTDTERDPWEEFNSDVFEFNYDVDQYVLKPVAEGFDTLVPDDVQESFSNVFLNIGFVPRFLNSLFQGKIDKAGTELTRFLVNSTLGVAGFFDVAKHAFDMEAPSPETAGQTLAMSGVSSGPYLMVPFLQPFTVRDFFGFVIDLPMNPVNFFIPILPNVMANVGNKVNERAENLDTYEGLEESTVDLYGAVRSAYFQHQMKVLSE